MKSRGSGSGSRFGTRAGGKRGSDRKLIKNVNMTVETAIIPDWFPVQNR